jgi:hypothetical protein
MVTMQPDNNPSNRPFWIFASIGALVVVSAIIIGFVFATGSQKEDETAKGNDDTSSYEISDTPPQVTDVKSSATETVLSFKIQTESYDQSKWFLEYDLADQNRKTQESGYAKSAAFETTTDLAGSAYYRIKVRLTDKDKVSAWSDSFTIKLEDVSGMKTLQPADNYYSTPWANGQGSQANLTEALTVAYGAVQLPAEQATGECIPLNSGVMTPELLLPPIPGVFPTGVQLAFSVNSWNETNKEGQITYYWC